MKIFATVAVIGAMIATPALAVPCIFDETIDHPEDVALLETFAAGVAIASACEAKVAGYVINKEALGNAASTLVTDFVKNNPRITDDSVTEFMFDVFSAASARLNTATASELAPICKSLNDSNTLFFVS